jgi:hypothetical protein
VRPTNVSPTCPNTSRLAYVHSRHNEYAGTQDLPLISPKRLPFAVCGPRLSFDVTAASRIVCPPPVHNAEPQKRHNSNTVCLMPKPRTNRVCCLSPASLVKRIRTEEYDLRYPNSSDDSTLVYRILLSSDIGFCGTLGPAEGKRWRVMLHSIPGRTVGFADRSKRFLNLAPRTWKCLKELFLSSLTVRREFRPLSVLLVAYCDG